MGIRLFVVFLLTVSLSETASSETTCASADDPSLLQDDVVLIKVGGSSITNKSVKETLNQTALDWFASVLFQQMDFSFRALPEGDTGGTWYDDNENARRSMSAVVVIHGAGSFGHHTASEFGLKGQTMPPPADAEKGSARDETLHATRRRHTMQGVASTRLSVQKLNRNVVSTFLDHGINAVGISPCFGVPSMQAHGGTGEAVAALLDVVLSTIQSGLVPVLHGDACLHGRNNGGILSGDTLMEMIGEAPWVSRAIFLTDVDGVFTRDPRTDPSAELLPEIAVDQHSSELVAVTSLESSGSTHEHDVTGGLKAKLKSAATIAHAGKNVTIAHCGSKSATQAIRNEAHLDKATVLFRQ